MDRDGGMSKRRRESLEGKDNYKDIKNHLSKLQLISQFAFNSNNSLKGSFFRSVSSWSFSVSAVDKRDDLWFEFHRDVHSIVHCNN